jgi:hypothetical protein
MNPFYARRVRFPAVCLMAAALLVGCGGDSDEEEVRQTVAAFGDATASRDYDRLCDDLLAPRLLEAMDQIGLPCRVALQGSFSEVEEPRLVIGDVRVDEDTAEADVRSSARGQAPSRDTLVLVRTDGGWRISELGGGAAPPPPPPEADHDHDEEHDEDHDEDEDEPGGGNGRQPEGSP